MIHFKGRHRDAFPLEGRSLLGMGFIAANTAVAIKAALISSLAGMEIE
jgi:hypothetical protein